MGKHSRLSNIFKLMKTSESIKLGYFGNPDGHIHERIKDFLGDYVAFGINKYYFNYKGENSILFKSHHAGITKEEIRLFSRASGLFTADKPAYACLATRIPSGTAITAPLLERTEWAENYMFSLGFSDFRVRTSGNSARLEINRSQLEKYYKLKDTVNTVLSEKYDGVSDEIGVRE